MTRGSARVRPVLPGAAIVLLTAAAAGAVTYTTPRQLNFFDIYQLNPDSATGDEETTCPKPDANDGVGGDNPYFQRTNVARAHVGGCSGRYWYTSSYRMLCTDVPPVNTCGGGPCVDEPDPAGPQYVDYIPPFGPGASELTPGRYRLTTEYRNTTSRAPYPAEYIVHHGGGVTTVLKSQLDGVSGSCPSFEIGAFDMVPGSFVRVNDTGSSSITFSFMRFELTGPPGGLPYVSAGSDQTVILPADAALTGKASDDGQPASLVVTWSKLTGPGTVTFLDASSATTTATFSEAGGYVLRLTAFDGANSATDDMTVTVLAAGATLSYSTQYEFNADPSLAAGVLDADAGDANGSGLLTKVGNGFGATGAGAGISNGILRYIDNGSTGNFGWYFQNGGNNLSFTMDMSVRVNAGVAGTTNRRSLGVSGGAGRNLGLRLHKMNDGATSACTLGSIRLVAPTGGVGDEACMDFSTPAFHRIRVSVDAPANTIRVFDMEVGILLSQASGSGGTVLSWADQINNLGGFQIGSISNSNTTMTDFELDYCRVLLGVAVDSATTPILTIGQCNNPRFDTDNDDDVDMDDFGVFQSCWTGDTDTITSSSCQCMDRNGDNRVGEPDLGAFKTCADGSRAGVAAAPECDGAP